MLFKGALILLLCQCIVLTFAQHPSLSFRRDYRYVDSKQSFYKLHSRPRTWSEAKEICATEGAALLFPEDGTEVHEMIQLLRGTDLYGSKILLGALGLSRLHYKTIDGLSVANMYNNWAAEKSSEHYCVVLNEDGLLQSENCTKTNIFICKKTHSTLEWDQLCDLPKLGYEYNEVTGRYKFHENRDNHTWEEAKKVCESESSYLSVINSPVEANILANLTEKHRYNYIKNDHDGCIFLGFYKDFRDWETIKGVSLAESGYSQWNAGEPNHAAPDETCGGMCYNGELNDVGCYQSCYFICERELAYSMALDTHLSTSDTDFETETVTVTETASVTVTETEAETETQTADATIADNMYYYVDLISMVESQTEDHIQTKDIPEDSDILTANTDFKNISKMYYGEDDDSWNSEYA